MTLDDVKWAIVAAKKLKIKQEVRDLLRAPDMLGDFEVVYHSYSSKKPPSDLYRRARQVLPSARTQAIIA